MIIDEIKLKNVGVFSGSHFIELTPPTPDKNIILFGGLNGAGKTTLLESIQLGLFGRQSSTVSRAESYEKHLRKLTSRTANAGDGSAIEVSFRIKAGGQFIHHRIIRSWEEKRGKVREHLEVFVDQMFDSALSDSWHEEVDRFLPPRLSPLFFFDGEKIESLANPATSTKILETAIVSLLGVDLVEQLDADLKILIAKKSKEALPDNNQKEIQELENELNDVLQQCKVLKDNKADLQADLDHAKLKYQNAEAEYAEKGGGLFELANKLKADRSKIESLLLANRIQLRQVASGALPLHLLVEKITEIKTVAESEIRIKKNTMLVKVHEKRDARITQQLETKGCPADVVKELISFLDTDRESLLDQAERNMVYDLDEGTLHMINQLCDGTLESSTDMVNQLLSDNMVMENQLNTIDNKLARVPDEEQIRDAFIAMQGCETRVAQLEGAILDVGSKLGALERKESILTAYLEKILGKADLALIQSEEQARVIEYSRKARSIMSRFKVDVINRHAKRLEVLIANSFKALLRKHNLFETVRINPHGCALSLYDSDGNEVLAGSLSAGERQLLATSILWALGKASGSNLPVVIDTPLGRLDSTHREHLLERYFPEASHQVILLSTDKEIGAEDLAVMGNKVGRYYLLDFDDVSRKSTVRKGYFGGEES